MQELTKALEFVVDLVCIMPPLDAIKELSLPPATSLVALAAALAFLVFQIIRSSISDTAVFGKATGLIAVCVVALAFVGLKEERKLFTSLIVPVYVALIITLRLLEGMLLGRGLRSAFRPWYPIVFLLASVLLYVCLRSVPDQTVALLKTGWALVGAGLAAFQWSVQIKEGADFASLFSQPLTLVAWYFVFVATFLYTQASPGLTLLYQWILPVGLAVGALIKWR